MNTFQRTIKYIAISLAVCLSLVIISSIAGGLSLAGSILTGVIPNSGGNETMIAEKTFEFENINSLDINNQVGVLEIKTNKDSNKIIVEAFNVPESFFCEQKNDNLKVAYKVNSFNFFGFGNNGFNETRIIIQVPENLRLNSFNVETGAGKTDISGINFAEKVFIKTGVGTFSIDNLESNNARIECGVGKLDVTNSKLANVSLNSGVGKVYMSGEVTGNSKIDCGVGSVSMDLKGMVEDYSFDISHGIGAVKVNGVKFSDGRTTNTNSSNFLKISGGIGSVDVNLR